MWGLDRHPACEDPAESPKDCGFWNEPYSPRGGMEAIYIDLPEGTGFGRFAPIRQPIGIYMSSGQRLQSVAAQREQTASRDLGWAPEAYRYIAEHPPMPLRMR